MNEIKMIRYNRFVIEYRIQYERNENGGLKIYDYKIGQLNL